MTDPKLREDLMELVEALGEYCGSAEPIGTRGLARWTRARLKHFLSAHPPEPERPVCKICKGEPCWQQRTNPAQPERPAESKASDAGCYNVYSPMFCSDDDEGGGRKT